MMDYRFTFPEKQTSCFGVLYQLWMVAHSGWFGLDLREMDTAHALKWTLRGRGIMPMGCANLSGAVGSPQGLSDSIRQS
jgi:hypothetical protein